MNDTGHIGNIAFDAPARDQDVAYFGRFDEELARWQRRVVADDVAVLKLAVALFLARYAPSALRRR